MNLTTQQADRAAGVLLGTAAGDALGAGYEFTHPAPGTPIDMIGGGTFAWAPGEWTDDTAMAVAIAEVAATGADIGRGTGLDAVAARFVAWFDSNPPDVGNQTRAVLSARPGSADAMRARARAIPGRKGGNGSLMRTAPVALAHLGDERGCVDAAAAVAALTHDDPQAIEACRMWTHAIRHAVLHGSFDGVRGYLKTAPAEVAAEWGPLLDMSETGSPADFSNNGWVVHALQTAWWAITSTDPAAPDHLPRALEAAVRAGGDTDTTAAIAGGLLGARWGASAVPDRWRRILHGWPGYTAADLVRMTEETVADGPARRSGPVIDVVEGDITAVPADAIVNAANSTLLGGGGVDGAIHRAGGPRILAECRQLRATTLPDGLQVGAAVATTAGNLPAQAVIHTVGPRYSGHEDRSALLRAAYTRSLAVADTLGAGSVAFPLISSGAYGWPLEDAVRQAVAAVTGADTGVERVLLVAYDHATAERLRRALRVS
ncbi:O-acetyl-ADP-ribose deacetylase [Rhodococcus sp. NPDC003348]